MNKHEEVLYSIVQGIVEDKSNLTVTELETLNEHEVLLHVYSNQADIARLIGKKGSTASAIRHLMLVAFSIEKKRFVIKFENFND